MRNIIVLIVFSFLSINLMAQEESLPKSSITLTYYEAIVPQELHSRITEFFKIIIRGETERAYNNLLKGSPLVRKDSELNNLIKQTERAETIYGRLIGFEAVDAEIASNSLIKCRYLGLYSKYPLRWIFTFYKSPVDGWIITNIKFDDQSDYYFRRD